MSPTLIFNHQLPIATAQKHKTRQESPKKHQKKKHKTLKTQMANPHIIHLDGSFYNKRVLRVLNRYLPCQTPLG